MRDAFEIKYTPGRSRAWSVRVKNMVGGTLSTHFSYRGARRALNSYQRGQRRAEAAREPAEKKVQPEELIEGLRARLDALEERVLDLEEELDERSTV